MMNPVNADAIFREFWSKSSMKDVVNMLLEALLAKWVAPFCDFKGVGYDSLGLLLCDPAFLLEVSLRP